MSALIGTNASLQAEVISDEILMATYFEVGLSLLTMLANIVNLFCLRKWFVSSVVYQIQQIDSFVTAVCQIGYIGILLSSISDTPNTYICNAASCLFNISAIHFFLSNLLMVSARYIWSNKVDRSASVLIFYGFLSGISKSIQQLKGNQYLPKTKSWKYVEVFQHV